MTSDIPRELIYKILIWRRKWNATHVRSDCRQPKPTRIQSVSEEQMVRHRLHDYIHSDMHWVLRLGVNSGYLISLYLVALNLHSYIIHNTAYTWILHFHLFYWGVKTYILCFLSRDPRENGVFNQNDVTIAYVNQRPPSVPYFNLLDYYI